ncbi:MAG TPA: YicC/YloC family endoribonuclease [Thermoanaerobaculia bacterium]|nr:YicC/YloC family endoribonuclease [Thermoanaerobaculia bacterium]
MRSMTGYGEASGSNARHAMTVSLKAVNHRFLDLQLRLGDELRGSEAALREMFARQLARGRVEAKIEARALAERAARVEVDSGVVRAVAEALRRLAEEGVVTGGLAAGDLLRIPAALRIDPGAEAWDEADHRLLLEVGKEALAQLAAGREREGAGLAAALLERLGGLEQTVARLDALRGPALEETAAALRRRVGELLAGVPLDEARVAQEVALLADRGDVSEEIDRLRSHLGHFRAVAAEPGPAGKRLDFLTQEIFRELNTLGAKCRNADMVRAVLDAKVICEQLREQVQNVE